MPGIGTLANVGMILGGSIIGIFLKKGVPERFKTIVFQALGTATFLIGLSGVLSGVLKTNDSGGLDSQYILLLILSLVLGGGLMFLQGTIDLIKTIARIAGKEGACEQ